MERRQFLARSSTAAVALAALSTVFGQKAFAQSADPIPTCPPPVVPPQITSAISRNHGHVLVLSYEEVIKGEAKVYTIQGSSGHPHTLEITEEIFAVLRKQKIVQVESSLDAGHTHLVEIRRGDVV